MPWLVNVNKWAGFTVFLMLNRHTMQAATRSKVGFMGLHWISNGRRSKTTERQPDVSSNVPQGRLQFPWQSSGYCLRRRRKGPLRMWLFLSECSQTRSRMWPQLAHRRTCPTGLLGIPWTPALTYDLPISKLSLFFLSFHWNIVDLQCRVSFRCQQSDSDIHMGVCILF